MPNDFSAPFIQTRIPVSRRRFLSGAGAAVVSLPLLEAMSPGLQSSAQAAALKHQESPHRLVTCCATLGFHAPFLVPAQTGKNYQPTPYLNLLKDHLQQLTVLSGISHPDQQGNNGHASELTWLTAARRPGLAGFRNTISIDQHIASQIGLETRFPFLALSTSGRSMSWSANGIEIPGETSAAKLFQSLFTAGTPTEIDQEIRNLKRGRSILDVVRDEAKQLHTEISGQDRAKLDEYFTAVRDLELQIIQSEDWVKRPKPQVTESPPATSPNATMRSTNSA